MTSGSVPIKVELFKSSIYLKIQLNSCFINEKKIYIYKLHWTLECFDQQKNIDPRSVYTFICVWHVT